MRNNSQYNGFSFASFFRAFRSFFAFSSKKNKQQLTLVLVLSFLNTALLLYAVRWVINITNSISDNLEQAGIQLILKMSGMVVIIYLIVMLVMYMQGRIATKFTQQCAKDLRNAINEKVATKPDIFTKIADGNILSIMTNAVDTLSSTLNNSLIPITNSLTLIMSFNIYMLATNIVLGLVTLLISIFIFIAIVIVAGATQKYYDERERSLGNLNSAIEKALTDKLQNNTPVNDMDFNKYNYDLYLNYNKTNFYGTLYSAINFFIKYFGLLIISIIGFKFMLDGVITATALVAYLLSFQMLFYNFTLLNRNISNLQYFASAQNRVFFILDF